jgi:FkbM family methyltransferase
MVWIRRLLRPIVDVVRFLQAHPLTRTHQLRALARFARWQVQSRLQDEVVVPWVDGCKLAVRRGMRGATGNIYAGLHEFNDMAFVLHFLRPDDLFVDVGANIGSYTILASGVRGARTIAFEPDPVTFAALTRNINLNELDILVEARKEALGATAGTANFTVGLDTINHVLSDASVSSRVVKMQTLDRVLEGRAPVLIKLDVEGFESEVIRGAAKLSTQAS